MMNRFQKALFAVNCLLSAALYAIPFLLEKTARKHMMFYRYLIVKQNWWAGEAFHLRLGLTAAVLAALLTIFLIKRGKRLCPTPFCVTCTINLTVAAVVMNTNPAVTSVYFMLLIASLTAAVISLLTVLIVGLHTWISAKRK